MSVIVLKFGGSSVATPQKVRRCAERAAATRAEGHDVVVVVSAMGDTTDRLISLARSISASPSRAVADAMLATGEQVSAAAMTLALADLGQRPAMLAWNELGIVAEPSTGSLGGAAVIRCVDAARIRSELEAGRIVVAPGFVGRGPAGELVTLGRGGSDTTAAAIAGALRSSREDVVCEIDTDVDGVFTADPRIVPAATRIDRISHTLMLELAMAGAHVLHAPSVEIARATHLTMHVRDAHGGGSGTRIVDDRAAPADGAAIGCALLNHMAMVTLSGTDASIDDAELRAHLRAVGVESALLAEQRKTAGCDARRLVVAQQDVEYLDAMFCGRLTCGSESRGTGLSGSESRGTGLSGSESRGTSAAPALSLTRAPVACVSVVGCELDRSDALQSATAALEESWISVHGVVRTARRFCILVDQEHAHEALRFLHRHVFEHPASAAPTRTLSFAEHQAV